MAQTLKAHLPSSETAETIVCAPALGRWRPIVSRGDLVQPGEALGELEILNQRHVVLLPHSGTFLRVSSLETTSGWSPVDFGAKLLVLEPLSIGAGGEVSAAGPSATGDSALPSDAQPITAPIEGLFYRAASQEDPPFVQAGDLIQPGQIIGLIEVMKFFYDIPFELSGFEEGARVIKVTAEDSEAVAPGQVLAYVVPA